jgi:hypothetical protein
MINMMFLQNPFVDFRIYIRVLVMAPVQVPDRIQTMHTMERADQDGEVLFVAGNGNAFVNELISLGFGDAHYGARVELHPLGVGFVAVAHVFGFLVAETAAEDFGFVADDVLGRG